MHISELPLLTDENIQPAFVAYLREIGFDVKEEHWQGEKDVELIKWAQAERRVICTHDSGFGRLVFNPIP